MPRRSATLADYQQRLLRAEQLIAQRLDQPLGPAALARAAGFSLHHFHRIFRAQLGETVMQHVRRLRLERAARQMRAREVRLLDLALQAGFESHEAFTRAFTERFGCTPSQFRAQPAARVRAWRRQAPQAPSVPITVQEFPALPVAFMRHRGSYQGVGQTWQRMLEWVQRRGLAPRLYGVCPDDPDVTEEALLRFDACVLAPDFTPEGELGASVIPAGRYAVGLHRGPYESLHQTYLDVIGRWFPSSGHELAPDPVVEHYLDDPSCTPAAELRTEVRVRIAGDAVTPVPRRSRPARARA